MVMCRIAAASAGIATALWLVFLFWNPYRNADPQGAVIPLLMFLPTLGALAAALLGSRAGALLFGLLLLPMGLYLLLTPGVFWWIGVANVVFLGAAVSAVRAEKSVGQGS